MLASDPDVLVLDEATSMIDPQGRDELVRAVLRARSERGTTLVWVTHDMELAARADRVVVMRAGAVAAEGAPAEVLSARALLESAGLEPPLATARLGGARPSRRPPAALRRSRWRGW